MEMTIFFGGSSFEHEISIVSAISLKKVLKKTKLSYIFVDQDRDFYLIEDTNMKSTYFSSAKYKKSQKLQITNGGFVASSFLKKNYIKIGTALNLIHGRDGEDGKLSSLFDFFNIPYIGPRVDASSLSYSKLLTKYFAKSIGVHILDFEIVDNNNREITIDFPVIIKPLKLGSSIGVSIVKDQNELEYALDVAFEFDDRVIVEPFIEGIKEYNLAGCKCDKMIYSIIEEPQKDEFLDFDKKYMDFSRTRKINEAQIDKMLEDDLKANFKKIYDPFFKGSLIRCDFFVLDGHVILNEINPIPGSMANYLFDEFEDILHNLSNNLPHESYIPINYQYINKIASAKGKSR